MPTSPYFPTLHGGTAGEQGLVQDLVDEQISFLEVTLSTFQG